MARYIGARYVPVFAGDWDQTREYEALTVVQYQGDSYTSKMYVPVGIAINNTMYWIKSANFNQQVAAMGTRIDALQVQYDQDIEDLQEDVAGIPGDINSAIDTALDDYIIRWPYQAGTADVGSIAAGGTTTVEIGIARVGYLPVGVAFASTSNSKVIITGTSFSGNTASVRLYNMDSASGTTMVNLAVIYVKNRDLG